ncbi:MAG: helix-turn-helix transcriptional regulator [Pseudomonadota bacterium]
MIVRKLRLRKGWSQDQLAELTDVSVRTIQRVERGHKPSLETAKALAAVFEVDVTTFITEHETMNQLDQDKAAGAHLEHDEVEALEYAKGVKDFLSGLIAYVILAVVFFSLRGFDEPLLYWVFGGIGLGLLLHGLMSFEVVRFPFQDLERKVAEKRLGRKL